MDYFLFSGKLPRIAGTHICPDTMAQVYASDFWNAIRSQEVLSLLGAEGKGNPGGNVIGFDREPGRATATELFLARDDGFVIFAIAPVSRTIPKKSTSRLTRKAGK
jgi:hypothetical protein